MAGVETGSGGGRGGALEQPLRLPTIASVKAALASSAVRKNGVGCEPEGVGMVLLLLEALLALVILVAIVWWTMFSGRNKGELKVPASSETQDPENTDKP